MENNGFYNNREQGTDQTQTQTQTQSTNNETLNNAGVDNTNTHYNWNMWGQYGAEMMASNLPQMNSYGGGGDWSNRRNPAAAAAVYGTDPSYIQRALFEYSQAGYNVGNFGAQKNSYGGSGGGDMGSRYGYGDMDENGPNNSTQKDSSYGDQSRGRGGFNYGGQNSFQSAPQKRNLSNYESNMALMQGGSYAGSSAYGNKDRNDDDSQGFGYDNKRDYFDSSFKNSRMYDDSRYRLGSGGGNATGNTDYNNSSPNFNAGSGRGRGGRVNDYGKRPGGGGSSGPWPKKKKAPITSPKNPVSFLNEIRPDIDFIVNDMEGPSNLPTFSVSIDFDGETYTAKAKSKKLAKRYAAEAALKVYLTTAAARQLGYSDSMIDFSDGPEAGETSAAPTPTENKTEENLVGGKNPVMFLNELRKDAVYDLKQESGDPHNKNFKMRVTVNGQQFEGTGQNKKLARAAAARAAIKGLGLDKPSETENDNETNETETNQE